MFGRKRHVAQVTTPPTPQLSAEALFELVHSRVADFIGERGVWTVTRRETDADSLFHGMLAHSIAAQITDAISAEQALRASGEQSEHALAETSKPGEGWVPAPITMLADLRRPVTGKLETQSDSRDERSLAA